jgi:hypothetical protein
MSTLNPRERERLLDLLADRAVGELAPADAAELADLLARAPDEAGYEDLVGGLILAADDPDAGDMPPALRSGLLGKGERMVGPGVAGRIDASADAGRVGPGAATPGQGGWVGWVAASPMVPSLPTPAQRLMALEAEPDTRIIPLEGQGELAAAGKAGEIVWNARLQEGFLRLSALPDNDPDQAQYQLWIFDKTRETYAVDGGVFNVARPGAGEVVVPFEPKLGVGDAAAFAVTRERPGGVVVTDQSGLVLLAPVPEGEG